MESSAPPFIGRGWRSGRASAARRGAVRDGAGDEAGQRPASALVSDGAVATRARGCLARSGVLVAGSGMRGGLQ